MSPEMAALNEALRVERFGKTVPEFHNERREVTDGRALRLVWDEDEARESA